MNNVKTTMCMLFFSVAIGSAQSITSSVFYAGYLKETVNGLKDYPLTGPIVGGGGTLEFPISDNFSVQSFAGLEFLIVFAKDDNYDLLISQLAMGIDPALKFGSETKNFCVGTSISVPIQSTVRLKDKQDNNIESANVYGNDINVALILSSRYEYISVLLGKEMTGKNAAAIYGAGFNIPYGSDNFIVKPQIQYSNGNQKSDLVISLGFEYNFNASSEKLNYNDDYDEYDEEDY